MSLSHEPVLVNGRPVVSTLTSFQRFMIPTLPI